MLKSIAKGTGMIGQAEELLYPAARVASQVGILYPRSSFLWDEQDVALPRGIMDCTNTHMLAGPDYLVRHPLPSADLHLAWGWG